jgi:hypothetical protein
MNLKQMKKEELLAAAQEAGLNVPRDTATITREELIELLLADAEDAVQKEGPDTNARVLSKLEQLVDLLSAEKYGKPVGDLVGFVPPEELSAYPKVSIIIYSNESPFGKFPVTLSCNGKTWNVPRDQRVEVPAPLVEILRNAVTKTFEQAGVNEEDGTLIWKERSVPRFQAQIEGAV